jgi:hypothetical protein
MMMMMMMLKKLSRIIHTASSKHCQLSVPNVLGLVGSINASGKDAAALASDTRDPLKSSTLRMNTIPLASIVQ